MHYTFTAARRVLADVIWLRERLETEVGDTEWRMHWIACVVLLRTIGHVAEKVDGKVHSNLLDASRALFAEWKKGDQHLIFREFINKERNSILKEYTSDVSEGPVPIVATAIRSDGIVADFGYLIEENLYRPMGGGYYDGEDGRTLIDDSINWWKAQLSSMEKLANSAC